MMHGMRKLLLLLMLAGISTILASAAFQDAKSIVRGKVKDLNGNSLAGASVTVENSLIGILTDKNGNYSISGLKNGVIKLKFSFIGYEPVIKEISLRGEETLDIILKSQAVLTEDVLITATRAGEHTPLAYTEIGKEMLQKQNTGQDIPFVLSLTPSLIETSEAGNGVGYTALRIRGTDGNRINVTIDGIPLNDPESQQVFWVDLPDLTSSVDNIQVQRGVGTSTNGSGSFGATISVQTRNPETEHFAEVSSSAGSFNTFKNMITLGSGLLDGKFSLQMRYSDLKSDGYIYRTGSNHRSAFISGTYRTGRSIFRANIILGEEHTGIGWWGVPAEMLSINRRYNPAGEYTDANGVKQYYNNESDNYIQKHLQLLYSLKLNNNLSLNAALHYTRGKGYYEEYAEDQTLGDYGIKPFTIGDSIISHTDLIRQKWMSNDFYGAVYSVKYQNERLEAIAGGGANIYVGDHYGTIIWMQDAGNVPKDFQWYLNKATKGEASFYGKVNYLLTENATIYGDLQYRYIVHKMNGPNDNLLDITQEHHYGFFNPKAGIFYKVSPSQDAYVSFSVGHKEPTRTDFEEASGDKSVTPKAETLYDFEAGYKLRAGKTILGINLYGMYYRDQLVPTGELSNVGYSIMTNVPKSHRSGIEITAALKPARFIDVNTSLTLSRNKIDNFVEHYTDYNTAAWSTQYLSKNLGNVDIAYSPSIIWSGDIGIDIVKGIDLHLIGKYVGKQYFDNTMSLVRTIDPYFINNLRVDISPHLKRIKSMEVQLMVNNVLNSMYSNNAYGGNWYEDGIEKTWAYFFPQAGRNYMTRITFKF